MKYRIIKTTTGLYVLEYKRFFCSKWKKLSSGGVDKDLTSLKELYVKYYMNSCDPSLIEKVEV